jgi:hypothetical protein
MTVNSNIVLSRLFMQEDRCVKCSTGKLEYYHLSYIVKELVLLLVINIIFLSNLGYFLISTPLIMTISHYLSGEKESIFPVLTDYTLS